MASCDACGSTILFGGTRDGDLRFCNEKCRANGYFVVIARDIPQDVVTTATHDLYRRPCPKCGGPGPVDVHTSHRVWSFIVLTQWVSTPHVVCRSCGVKRQAGDALISLVAGWWGFPWGIIFTPVQIVRNIAGMLKSPQLDGPSPQLEQFVRLALARQITQQT